MKTINVTIEARHAEGADYVSMRDCALARVLKEQGFTGVNVSALSAYTDQGSFSFNDGYRLQQACGLSVPWNSPIELPFTLTLTEIS